MKSSHENVEVSGALWISVGICYRKYRNSNLVKPLRVWMGKCVKLPMATLTLNFRRCWGPSLFLDVSDA